MEIELKLALDPLHVRRLRREMAAFEGKPVVRRLHNIYLDTPEQALTQRGMALRVRRSGRQWVQTLKAESASVGALTSRPEWEVPLPRGQHDLARFPAEARALLAALDAHRIAPVFVTSFRRTAWTVSWQGAVLEVALDEGEILAGERRDALHEVEIELKSGPPQALFSLAIAWLKTVPLGIEPRSKAARGYALANASHLKPTRAVMPPLTQDMDAGAAWTAMLVAALVQVSANVPAFLQASEDYEYLHQLRVGLRRLHAIAALYASLDGTQPRWLADLKTLMKRLNAARDWDVLIHERLPEAEQLLRSAQGSKVWSADFHRHLAHRALVARQQAMAAVASPDFTRLVLEIGQDLLTSPHTNRGVRDWAAMLLERRWQVVLKHGKGFAALSAARRHRLRIAVKKMRYAAEALTSLFRRTDKINERLGALQGYLGGWQDCVVVDHLMREFEGASADVCYDAGRLAGALAAKQSGLGPQGARLWQALFASRPYWHASKVRAKGRGKACEKEKAGPEKAGP